MAKINVLTSDVYNKIAAGEVVERPCSVVKELVENSIDASASRIEIAVDDRGAGSITVSDNGCGIDEEDLSLAFLKHATSKLSNAEQLDGIETLGFRGEALSSISSVAKVQLTTKTPFADTAVTVEVEEGRIVSKNYCSANTGTSITVSDLFYNTPARKKFLKSPSRESSEITQYIARLILANDLLEITYILNGKDVYRFKGGGAEEAIYCVYGADCLKNCLQICSEYNSVVVKGYVGSPEYTKANSTYQTMSVNGRYVRDVTIQSAVKQAFSSYLMTRSYPFFVLHIQLPFDQVDVNVHPSKMEVRFADKHKVFTAVHYPIKQALKKFTEQKVDSILAADSQSEQATPLEYAKPSVVQADFFKDLDGFNGETMSPGQRDAVDKIEQSDQAEERGKAFDKFVQRMSNISVEEILRQQTAHVSHNTPGLLVRDDSSETTRKNVAPEPKTVYVDMEEDFVAEKEEKEAEEDLTYRGVRILGIAFNTYLLLEVGENLVIIDQHAAHERVLFDKYMANIGKLPMQDLMFPYVFTVTEQEAEHIEENLPLLKEAGFDVKPFGTNTFRISSVASMFVDMKLDKFVSFLVSSLGEKIESKQLLKEAIAKRACRQAIKAGYTLNNTEIRYIVKAIVDNKALQCPHGRPITVVFSKTQLEKMFKRLV